MALPFLINIQLGLLWLYFIFLCLFLGCSHQIGLIATVTCHSCRFAVSTKTFPPEIFPFFLFFICTQPERIILSFAFGSERRKKIVFFISKHVEALDFYLFFFLFFFEYFFLLLPFVLLLCRAFCFVPCAPKAGQMFSFGCTSPAPEEGKIQIPNPIPRLFFRAAVSLGQVEVAEAFFLLFPPILACQIPHKSS